MNPSERLTSALLLLALTFISPSGVLAATPNPMLHRSGTHIVDGNGRRVSLRGVNLGGWMLWEGWEFGQGFTSENTILNRLNTLVGPEETQAFRRGIYERYVTEDDLRRISELGFNSVRVPLNCRLLMAGPPDGVYHQEGWEMLDRLLSWCDRYHLYAVLDLHAAPGGQSRIFTANPGAASESLWNSETSRAETVALWRSLADRYKGRACVAGYDLLNESTPPDDSALVDLYRRIIAAVREVDPYHLMILEGTKLASDLSPLPATLDENVALRFHLYTWFGDDRRKRLDGYHRLAIQRNVPLWVGEFGENSYEMIGSTVKMFDQMDEIAGWAFWPWKRAPSSYPGLVTIRLPPEWKSVVAWISMPIFHARPKADQAKPAIDAFLEAVKLGNCELDTRMAREMIGH